VPRCTTDKSGEDPSMHTVDIKERTSQRDAQMHSHSDKHENIASSTAYNGRGDIRKNSRYNIV